MSARVSDAALFAADQVLLRIFRREHPEVTSTVRPRAERNSAAAARQIRRSISAPDQRDAFTGRAA